MEKRGIYVLYDNKAKDIVGFLQVHKHVTVAIRTFTDIAMVENSLVPKHPEDYDLLHIGILEITEDGLKVDPVPNDLQLVITGLQLMAELTAKHGNNNNA